MAYHGTIRPVTDFEKRQPADPTSRSDLSRALARAETDVHDFFESLSPEEYVLRVEAAWTPAEHLEHLNEAVHAVARGLSVPRWLLHLRFGRSNRPSRSYLEIRDTYQAALARGGRATGRFIPPRRDLSIEEVKAHRSETLARWARRNGRLRAALEGWTESRLDQIQMPHPIIGRLTTREMIFFTLYHDQHHINGAKRRLPRFANSADVGLQA